MKIVYIFPQCICNKYYACNFTKSLLLFRIHCHYFHHLNVQKFIYLFIHLFYLTLVYKIVENNSTSNQNYNIL